MKKIGIIFLSLALIMVLASKAQTAIVLELDFGQDGFVEDFWVFDPRPENPKNVAIVDVLVSNVYNEGKALLSMGFSLDFDKLLFQANSASVAPDWYVTPMYEINPGEVIMKGGRLLPGLSGDKIKLGTIELQCIKYDPNPSEFWIHDSDRTYGEMGYDDFVSEDGTVHDKDLPQLVARCPNVPIPTTFLLLGCGLIGLAGLKRKTS